MDAKEIMANEEVMEVTEDIVKAGTGKGFKVAAGVGVIMLVGGLAYKFVIKPAIAKFKTKNEQENYVEVNPVDYSEEAEEDFESEEN